MKKSASYKRIFGFSAGLEAANKGERCRPFQKTI